MLRCASVRRSQPDFLVGAAGASDAFSRVHSAGRPSRAQLPRLTSRQPPILWLLLATALSLNPVFSASAPAALATARPLSRHDTLSATRRSGRLRRLADHQSFHRNHCLVPSQLPLPLLSPGLKHSLLLKHSLSRPPYAPPPPCATPKIGATSLPPLAAGLAPAARDYPGRYTSCLLALNFPPPSLCFTFAFAAAVAHFASAAMAPLCATLEFSPPP